MELDLLKYPIKLVSINTSRPLSIFGLYINLLSSVPSKYLLILFIAISWYTLGLLEKILATNCNKNTYLYGAKYLKCNRKIVKEKVVAKNKKSIV